MIFKYVAGVLVLIALAGGGYVVMKERGARSLGDSIAPHLQSGDYLAALAAAGELKKEGKSTPELEKTIEEAARLLVAKDAFLKATQAAKEGRWADARTLLSASDAITNPAFTSYEEAKKLYEEAEALAAGVAHKTAVTISTLEERAKEEKKKGDALEKKRQTLETALTEKEKALTETQAGKTAAEQDALVSKKQAETSAAALLSEQANARALALQVENEGRQKFFNEFRTYRDLAAKGKEQLDNALVEINGKRDVTALIFLSQAKILFDETKSKTADLRNNRTPALYQPRADTLLSALGSFLDAAKQLRNAVVYIDDQGSADFTAPLAKAKSALATGADALSRVSIEQ